MLVREKAFPSFVEASGHAGYLLRLPVKYAGEPTEYIDIAPPRRVVPAETNVWPGTCFEILLLASEYCAALLEFMTWAFPDDCFPNDWNKLKGRVASHARQFIRESAAVPPPAASEGSLGAWQQLNAHSVWAAFTHCYFHGLPLPDAADEGETSDWKLATTWLHRLVGDQGWQAQGPVYRAAKGWVESMLNRLRQSFPDAVDKWISDWRQTASGIVQRSLGTRGDVRTPDDAKRFYPIYPLRITGGLVRNQFKWKMQDTEACRTIAGSCGVPAGFSQVNNCALGYLVLADVVEAFGEATKGSFQGQSQRQQQVMQDFIRTVVFSDEADLLAEHEQYGYPLYLAACALGWQLALSQVNIWLVAAADSASAAGMSGLEAAERELLMPTEMALPGLRDLFLMLQLRQQQAPQTRPASPGQLPEQQRQLNQGQRQQQLLSLQLLLGQQRNMPRQGMLQQQLQQIEQQCEHQQQLQQEEKRQQQLPPQNMQQLLQQHPLPPQLQLLQQQNARHRLLQQRQRQQQQQQRQQQQQVQQVQMQQGLLPQQQPYACLTGQHDTQACLPSPSFSATLAPADPSVAVHLAPPQQVPSTRVALSATQRHPFQTPDADSTPPPSTPLSSAPSTGGANGEQADTSAVNGLYSVSIMGGDSRTELGAVPTQCREGGPGRVPEPPGLQVLHLAIQSRVAGATETSVLARSSGGAPAVISGAGEGGGALNLDNLMVPGGLFPGAHATSNALPEPQPQATHSLFAVSAVLPAEPVCTSRYRTITTEMPSARW